MSRARHRARIGAYPHRRTGTHFAGICAGAGRGDHRTRWRGRAGFTLIEVLVALAVVAASIGAIGALVAVSMRGTQSIERRLAFRETLRAIVTTLPDGRDLAPGSASGAIAGYAWRMDVVPFASALVDPQAATPWEPQAVEITVRSPSGQVLRVHTIRLRRRPG